MTLEEAIYLIRPGIRAPYGNWADIGAGTGMFTNTLLELFTKGGLRAQRGIEKGGSRGNRGSGEDRGSTGKGGSRGSPPSHDYGEQCRIYAVDKSPHALWALKSTPNVEIVVVEADFNEPFELPPLDGIVMANALHYANDPLVVLQNVVRYLKHGGTFILVEYETEEPRPPWVPHPVPFKRFRTLCTQAHLVAPEMIGTHASKYGFEFIYAAMTTTI